MYTQPQPEHAWLQKLVGEWTCESESVMGPGEPPQTFQGKETVRPLGGFWIIAEGQGEMPDGETACTLMTLGYDPHRKRFPGTWHGSMMSWQWVYDGELDESGRILTLNCEGPDMTGNPEKLVKFRDVHEFVSNDHRILRSYVLGDDGQWQQFMTTNYHRVR